MSKIYKVTDVSSLPESGEADVLYLLQVEEAREAYIWDGSSFVPVAPNENSWKEIGTYGKLGNDYVVADVSEYMDIASEFMVRIFIRASSATVGVLETVFPNKDLFGTSGIHNQMTGYYYDSSYNCCCMIRFNRNNGKIFPVTSWMHIAGGDNASFEQYEVCYR